MGRGLRGKAQRALERAVGAVLPGTEFVFVAFQAMRRYKRHFGVYPNLIHPKTFNEKVLCRIVFDRRPILITLQDKYAARDYVRRRIGEHVLPQLYWVTKTPSDIPFNMLPRQFVVKASHGAGWVSLVPDKASLKTRDLLDKCTYWLSQNYYWANREWAYKTIEPRIMVEEFVSDGTGLAPTDYKFYVFGGRVRWIWVMTDRFVDPRSDAYTPSWDRLDIKRRWKPVLAPLPRPPHLDEMIHCAEILGSNLDFVRIDLYDADKVYFGEMTLYPSAGVEISDPEANRYYGGLWDLSFGRT